MKAQEYRIGNFDNWVVHLKIEKVRISIANELSEETRIVKGLQRTAVAIGIDKEVSVVRQNQLSIRGQSRQHSLAEKIYRVFL